MAATEIDTIDQVNQLKTRIESKCKTLPRKEREIASWESLVLFQDLEDFPLVVQQHEFKVQWKQTDALYFFTDSQPAYVVDYDVFVQWSSAARPNVPQAFGHGDATTLATYHALMLSLVLFCHVDPSTGEASPDISSKKVFSAMVVFVHPSQQLMSIEEGIDMLLVLSCDPANVPVTALCCLPEQSIVLSLFNTRCDLSAAFQYGCRWSYFTPEHSDHCCNEFTVWHLHRWVHPYGPVMALPPLYSPDPGLPNVYLLDELPMLWTNLEYMAAVSDDDVSEVGHPAMTLVSTRHLEVDANTSQISLTNDEFIQYMTIDIDAKNSSGTKSNEAAGTGNTKVTPMKKTKKAKKTKEEAVDDDDSSSDSSQDAGVFSNGGGKQQSRSGGFQGWSNDKADGNEDVAVANIIAHLKWDGQDCQDSGVGMGSDDTKSKFVGIVPEDQAMVDMTTHNKATGSGATMDRLRCLGDDIIELSWQLNHKMELATLSLFDKVKAGFSGTGGVARQFIGDMFKLATDFFMDTRMYEAQLDSTDTEAFQTAVAGLQDRVNELLQQATILEDKYQHSKASFDTILVNMHQEICKFANQESRRFCNKYKCCTFDWIALDHAYITHFLKTVITKKNRDSHFSIFTKII